MLALSYCNIFQLNKILYSPASDDGGKNKSQSFPGFSGIAMTLELKLLSVLLIKLERFLVGVHNVGLREWSGLVET